MTLPEGWHIGPLPGSEGHAMWTALFDDKRTVRAEIFYKAAFYDQRADIDWLGSIPYRDQS